VYLPGIETFALSWTAVPFTLVVWVCSLHPYMMIVYMYHEIVHTCKLPVTALPMTVKQFQMVHTVRRLSEGLWRDMTLYYPKN